MNLTEKILDYLESNNISFKEVDHDIAPTCEDSARLRGEDIRIGGKTLLFKDKKSFKLFVISAALKVDSNKVRKILSSSKLRFATNDELKELCGVEKGALPPFGRPLQDFDLYVDESIKANDLIAFNAGLLTKSIIFKTTDYLKLIDPIFCNFSRDD
jgi:Ala-tRNA(Pro) deacylase